MPSTCRKRRLKRLSWKGIQFVKHLLQYHGCLLSLGVRGGLFRACVQKAMVCGCGGGGCETTGRAGVGVVGWMSGVSLGQRGGQMTD